MPNGSLPAETFTFTPRNQVEQPAEKQLRVLARPLTVAERARAFDDANYVLVLADGTKEERRRTWTQALELMVSHVLRIENLPADVPPYPGESTGADKLAWIDAHLSDITMLAIGDEIRSRASLRAVAGN
jgi:hypothetical protein